MLRIIKTNIYLMNKVSLISLNHNEIFIAENEVCSLLCTAKCHCWLLRAASWDPCGSQGGEDAGTLLLRSGKTEAEFSIVSRIEKEI